MYILIIIIMIIIIIVNSWKSQQWVLILIFENLHFFGRSCLCSPHHFSIFKWYRGRIYHYYFALFVLFAFSSYLFVNDLCFLMLKQNVLNFHFWIFYNSPPWTGGFHFRAYSHGSVFLRNLPLCVVSCWNF